MLSFEEWKAQKKQQEQGGGSAAEAAQETASGTGGKNGVMSFEQWREWKRKQQNETAVPPMPQQSNAQIVAGAREFTQAHQAAQQGKWNQWQTDYQKALAESEAVAETTMPEPVQTEMEAEEEPVQVENTGSMAQEYARIAELAQQAYDAYIQSDEYRDMMRANMAAQAAAMLKDSGIHSYTAAGQQTQVQEDQKEKELRAIRDYYRLLAQQAADREVMEADLAEFESWPMEDRAAMEEYVRSRDERDDPHTVGNPFLFALRNKAVEKPYSQLIEKYGADKVEQLAETYERYLHQQDAEKVIQDTTAAVETVPGAIGHNVLGVGARTIGGVYGALGRYKELIRRTGRYGTLEQYGPYDTYSLYGNTVLSATAQNISGDEYDENGEQISDGGAVRQTAAYAYQGLMSSADSLARAALGGGNKVISLGLAAASSFGQTMSEASERGASPAQALLMSVTNGGLEVATEYLPLDEILKVAKGGPVPAKKLLKNIFKQAAIEVTEEEVSYLGSLLAEAVILQGKSGYNQQIAEAVANGASYEDAVEQANRDVIWEAAETAFSSGFSGGISGAVSSTAANIRNRGSRKTQEQQPIHSDAHVELADMQVQFEQETWDMCDRIAKATGRNIKLYQHYGPGSSAENGYFQDGVIYVNTRSGDPVAQIISHELTHSVEFAKEYRELSRMVLGRIEAMGGDLKQLRQQKADLYAQEGHPLGSQAEVDQEIVAEFVAKNLLTDEQQIMEVARQNRTLAQKIKGWIEKLLGALGNKDAAERAYLTRVQNLYAKALQQPRSVIKGPQNVTAGAENVGALHAGDGVREVEDADTWDENAEEMDWNDPAQIRTWAQNMYSSGQITDAEFDYYVNMAEQLGEENSGRDTINEKTTKRQYSFAGQNARTANSQTLAEAKELDEAGADNETIRQQTGWFKGMDGKWRFEVDDSSSRISENVSNYMTLGELLQDAEILKAYPNMADVSVVFQSLPKGVNASYSPQFDTIDVSYSLKGDPEAIRAAVLHEVQHVIQRWEGFTTGTTVGSWDRKIKAGFDSRRGADIRKARETEQKIRRVQEEEPEFYRDMMELDAMKPDGPRGEVNWDTLEQITEDPPEWQAFDARRDQLQEIYGDMKVWDFMDLLYQQEKAAKNEGRTATELYWDTAGEIEARNTAGRRNLTAEERKNTPPMLGDEDTVFADDTGISFDQEISDYPYDMQTVIQEYIDSVDENVLTFVDKVQNGQAWRGQKVTVGTANSRMVEDIARLTGVENAEDCKILMNSNAVEHIQKRHGANGEHDNTMRNNRDIARINFVLQNYDSMKLGHRISGEYKNRDGTKAKMVVLSKKINGTYFVIEAVPDTGKIGIVSAYMNRNGAPQVPDENAPSLNVHDELASAPNGIVPSENPTVKRQMSISQTVSRKNVADDLREILNRGGDVAELRRYVGQLEQGGGNAERTGWNAYQSRTSAEQTEARRIVSMAKRYGISVEEYLRRNWEQYEVDGQWNEAARKALDMERGGRKYSLSGSTDNQGRQLSRGQAEYFKDSQARDENGNLMVLYHQTENVFTVFDTHREGAGKNDNATPFGIFLKSTDRDIGLKGKKQMPLYVNITNPLNARNREDLVHQLRELSPEYRQLHDEINGLDQEYRDRIERAKQELQDYMVKWRSENENASRTALYDDAKFMELFDAEDQIVDEWTEKADELDRKAKNVITDALIHAGFDGI